MSEYSPLVERIQRIQNVYAQMSGEQRQKILTALMIVKEARVSPQLRESELYKSAIRTLKAFPVKAQLQELEVVAIDDLWTRQGETMPDDFYFTMSGDEG